MENDRNSQTIVLFSSHNFHEKRYIIDLLNYKKPFENEKGDTAELLNYASFFSRRFS